MRNESRATRCLLLKWQALTCERAWTQVLPVHLFLSLSFPSWLFFQVLLSFPSFPSCPSCHLCPCHRSCHSTSFGSWSTFSSPCSLLEGFLSWRAMSKAELRVTSQSAWGTSFVLSASRVERPDGPPSSSDGGAA